MRLYLDVCCLNRPFDDQTQDRIRLEAEAVTIILGHLETKEWEWVGSDAVTLEIAQTADEERRRRTQLLAAHMHETIRTDSGAFARAQELVQLGFQPVDALHLACAERGVVDIFLTTDDRLLRLANRTATQIQIQVANPLAWLAKALDNDS